MHPLTVDDFDLRVVDTAPARAHILCDRRGKQQLLQLANLHWKLKFACWLQPHMIINSGEVWTCFFSFYSRLNVSHIYLTFEGLLFDLFCLLGACFPTVLRLQLSIGKASVPGELWDSDTRGQEYQKSSKYLVWKKVWHTWASCHHHVLTQRLWPANVSVSQVFFPEPSQAPLDSSASGFRQVQVQCGYASDLPSLSTHRSYNEALLNMIERSLFMKVQFVGA